MIVTSPVSYRIDSLDRITSVGDEWVSFARANGGERVLPPGILGKSLWSWIVDAGTRQIYQSVLARVRKGAVPVRFQFRCDGPDQRRLLQMQITAAARLFEKSSLPRLSHGICPRCHETMLAALDDPELAASGQITVGALPPHD